MSRNESACLFAFCLLLFCRSAPAQEWTRFRGPNGSGESEASTIPASWTNTDYNWRVQLPGIGHSSPVLWGERIFLTSAEDGQRRLLLCLSSSDGSVIWKKGFDAATHPIHDQNSFASSSPAVDERHVFVIWGTPAGTRVVALDHQGELAWQTDLGPFVSQHGFGASPIVYEDLLIVNSDQDGESSLVALNRADGKERWRSPRRTAVVAYSTPCVYRPEGKPAELIFNSQAHGISSIDPDSGKTNWEIDVFDKRSVSSPLVVGGLVFGSCGSGGGGNYVVAVRPGREPKLAYKIDKSAPYVPTSVARGNLLFLWGDAGVVSCIHAPSGKLFWQKRVGGNFSGSPVRAADRLYCMSAEGDVVVLAAKDEFELLSRQSLGELSRSTPAIAGGRMYLRTQSHLTSVGGHPKRPAPTANR
jgi:outer membrane protein assembly factor BamB